MSNVLSVSLPRKLTKAQSFYRSKAPPPIFYEYECRTCLFFLAEEKKCGVVDEKGEPDLDVIEPKAWCILWFPQPFDIPFGYIARATENWLRKDLNLKLLQK